MRRLLPLAGIGAAKADPLFYALALSAVSAASNPREVLDDGGLLLWLVIGSMCGLCYALFKDEKKALTWRGALSKLSVCFVPGFCLTGAGIKLSGSEPSPSIVLGLAMVLSVAGVKVVEALSKKVEGRISGGEL